MKPCISIPSNVLRLGLLTASLAGSLQAAVTFTVSDVGPAVNTSTPPASSRGSVSTGTIPEAPGPITYTLSGLDFTTIGGSSNEQITFTVSFSAVGGSVAYNTGGNGNLFVSPGATANQIDPGESLTATLNLTQTTFAGGLSKISAGFTSTTIGGAGTGESWNIVYDGGTQAGSTALGITRTLPTPSTFWTIQDVASTAANPGVNLQGYTVTLSAVPESSAALLGGLGLLAFLRRRR
jgi:hypothetical protein